MDEFICSVVLKLFIAAFSLWAWFGTGDGLLKDIPGQGYRQMHEVIAVFFSWQNSKLDVLKSSQYKTSKHSA